MYITPDVLIYIFEYLFFTQSVITHNMTNSSKVRKEMLTFMAIKNVNKQFNLICSYMKYQFTKYMYICKSIKEYQNKTCILKERKCILEKDLTHILKVYLKCTTQSVALKELSMCCKFKIVENKIETFFTTSDIITYITLKLH